MKFEIRNSQGQLVRQFVRDIAGGINHLTFEDMTDMPAGTYYYRCLLPDNTVQGMLIKADASK